MAKAVRWKIEFVSNIEKTKYRIDIYAEQDGTWSGVTQLLGGPQPFVTEENKSDDFFTPVRSQTGNIQVCTAIPAGGTLSLDDILPANNIDHPVRLVSIAANNAETIEWQGFLSCEAYSQSYTSIPQILTLPVISVLEAMDSVQADTEHLSGLKTVVATINNIMETFIAKADVSYFTQYYVPSVACGRNILSKKIDNTVLFDKKEYNNENSTTYIVDGISLKECLRRIAAYMGWCVRENNISLFFMAANETSGYNRHSRQGQITPSGIVITWMSDINDTSVATSDIASMQWRGIDHKRNVRQGAKSVALAAKLEKYNLNIEIPDCPVGSLVEMYRQLWYRYGNGDWLYMLANSNATAYSNMSVAYYAAVGGLTGNNWGYNNYDQSSISQLLDHIAVGPNSSVEYVWRLGHNGTWWYAGAFLCKYDWESTGTATAHDTSNALYCAFLPLSLSIGSSSIALESDFDPSQVGAIFSIDSVVNFRVSNGYIKLFANSDTIYWYDTFEGQTVTHSNNINDDWAIALELSIGNNWWNGSSWQSSQCYFFARMTGGGFKSNWDESMSITKTDGLLIPITSSMQGVVKFKIWPMASNLASDGTTQSAHSSIVEMIFSQLNVDHVIPDNSNLTDRSKNHYFRLLGTNFSDEVSVDTELASSLNNLPSPSLIMNSDTEPMTELSYGTESRRPEVDLLNRLAAYYGAARQTLELKVKHPTAAALPLLKLNGISPDTKKYLPLAESRDWIADVATLTCFETPE